MLTVRVGGGSGGSATACLLRGQLDGAEIHTGDRLAETEPPFDALEVSDLIGRDERYHDAAPAGSGGPARSVEVDLVVGGKVEVDDGPDILDMYAPGDNVGRNQGLDPSGGEVLQRLGPLVLAAFAVDRGGPDAIPIELADYPVTAMTGPGKDNRRSGGGDRLGSDLDPIRSGNAPEHMVGSDDIGSCRTYSVTCRIVLVVADECPDRTIECGREQHRLSVARGLVEQAPHCRHEPHVSHPVGLIDNDLFDGREVDSALIDQVFKAAGARYQDVNTAAEGSELGSVTDTAVDDPDPSPPREGAKLGHDLMGEFSGRGQHERAGLVRSGVTCIGHERDTEGERLA